MNAVRKRPEETLWRVGAGVLEPYDAGTSAQLRAKGFKRGDVLATGLKKARNPGFNSLAHKLGSLLAENLDAFESLDSHKVLKRLQIEGHIGCDEIALNFPGVGPCVYRVPRSLSFASMDEGEFQQVIKAMCKYVAKTYWPTCTPEQVEQMASCWVEPT